MAGPTTTTTATTPPTTTTSSAAPPEEAGADTISTKLDDVVKGMMYASLAITDDQPMTLAKIGKANPWHIQALKLITGDETQAHAPLSKILDEDMELTLVHLIDQQCVTTGCHFIDTQGFIAKNDSMIVISYRCTTSAYDWLTNFQASSSIWEIETDYAQGFSGVCS